MFYSVHPFSGRYCDTSTISFLEEVYITQKQWDQSLAKTMDGLLVFVHSVTGVGLRQDWVIVRNTGHSTQC